MKEKWSVKTNLTRNAVSHTIPTMQTPRIVIDTNVFISAIRSQYGASYRLLNLIDSGKFHVFISATLILEYEEVALRLLHQTNLTPNRLEAILDYISLVAYSQKIYYLWRPLLRDADDDMILELAIAGQCDAIITFNTKHFSGAERFGVQVLTPKQFLKQIGEQLL